MSIFLSVALGMSAQISWGEWNPAHCELARALIQGIDHPLPSREIITHALRSHFAHRDGWTFEALEVAFRTLEDQVLGYFMRFGPNHRDPRTLAAMLGISTTAQARELLLYYNLDDALDVTRAEGQQIYNRIRQHQFIRAHQDTIRYFHTHVARLSVAEMARERSTMEGNIYQMLFLYDISIEAKWRVLWIHTGNLTEQLSLRLGHHTLPPNHQWISRLDMVLSLRNQGAALIEISRILDISEDAISSILHYVGIEPRGEIWSSEEVQRLYGLYGLVPVHVIANVLTRTEASVSAKAGELGLRAPATLGIPNVSIDPYGPIKQNGEFQRDALRQYLLDHITQPRHVLAQQLNCSVSTLAVWEKKLGIFRPALSLTQRTSSLTPTQRTELRDRFARQDDIVAQLLTAIGHGQDVYTRGTFPGGLSAYSKASGTGVYNPRTGEFAHVRMFDSSYDLWIAVDQVIDARLTQLRAQAPLSAAETTELRHLEAFSVFNILFQKSKEGEGSDDASLPPEILTLYDKHRPQERIRTIHTLLTAIGHGHGVYTVHTFPGSQAAYSKATGTGTYNPRTGEYAHLRVFDSSTDMWAAVTQAVQERVTQLRASGENPEQLAHFEAYLRR